MSMCNILSTWREVKPEKGTITVWVLYALDTKEETWCMPAFPLHDFLVMVINHQICNEQLFK